MGLFKRMTAGQVMERWNIKPFELVQAIECGLPIYRKKGKDVVDAKSMMSFDFNPDEFKDQWAATDNKPIPDYFFMVSDVEAFEGEYPELLNEDSLSGKEKRELGQLRSEKEKLDDALKAAVEIGLWAADKTDITRPDFHARFEKKYKLPGNTIEKIFMALPKTHRAGSGRPKKD